MPDPNQPDLENLFTTEVAQYLAESAPAPAPPAPAVSALSRPTYVPLSKASITPTDAHVVAAERAGNKRTGIYFECPQSLIDAMNVKLNKLKKINKKNLGYSISKRDIFINFLINWLAEPVVLLREINSPGEDYSRVENKEPDPRIRQHTRDRLEREFNQLDAELENEILDESSVGERLNAPPAAMVDYLAEGGSILDLLEQSTHTISPLLPDQAINSLDYLDQIEHFNKPDAAITTDPLGNNINLNYLDRNLLKLRKSKSVRVFAIPAGHVQRLFPASLELINAPENAYYMDEGGNFYNQRGEVWNPHPDQECYQETIGSAQWQYTIWRSWLLGWRPMNWTPRFDEVIADGKRLLSPIALKEARHQPVTNETWESWKRNYLTITNRPMDNTLALHSFITAFENHKVELASRDDWAWNRSDGKQTARPQAPNQQFVYPEWVLKRSMVD